MSAQAFNLNRIIDSLKSEKPCIILQLPCDFDETIEDQLNYLNSFKASGFSVCTAAESEPPKKLIDIAAKADIPIHTLSIKFKELKSLILKGHIEDLNSAIFTNELSQITPEWKHQASCILSGNGSILPPVPDMHGCTLVTSVFKTDEFIGGFVNNSIKLFGYEHEIDHIFVVSKLSDIEQTILEEHFDNHRNVVLCWNRKDPGLYNCWNQGIRLARRRYVSNANVDDLRDPAHVRTLIKCLEANPEAHVAATALNPFYTFPHDGRLPEEREGWYSDLAGPFTLFDLAKLITDENGTEGLEPHNIPHCMPVWRHAIHKTYGWFDEDRYGTYADWAFWMKSMSNGGRGILDPNPLSFYYVNLNSHNRRGNDLERLHKVVESDFLPLFKALRDNRPTYEARTTPNVPAKLSLMGLEQCFGVHRNSFNRLIEALAPLATGDENGVLFIPFLERYFVWGDAPGEAASNAPEAITRDWVGILHVPFDAPKWYGPEVSPETFFDTALWRDSKPHCRGIITLAKDLEADLNYYEPSIPTLSVLHPTELNVHQFDYAAYRANPRVVQVGDWLRKLQAIHRLPAAGHERIMLLKGDTLSYLDKEITQFGDQRDPRVTMRSMVSNEEYDNLLSTSVVICLLYATAANNVVIECLARATPILINPLPAVVEYLGENYPLYARDEIAAAKLLAAPGKVEEAHQYLKKRRHQIDLNYSGFLRSISESEWYAALEKNNRGI